MSAWYSNILTNTTSRISNLRSTLLGGDADGDTEDDTHVCRVLRGYYVEKGRTFPPWLPPDPKAPQQTAMSAVPVGAGAPGVGARYGGGNLTPSVSAGSGGGLSSLWDGGGRPSTQQREPTTSSLRPGSAVARPLPSQRLGSYQSTQSAPAPSLAPAAAAAPSAQGKLRNMFGSSSSSIGSAGGSRSNSPAQVGSGGGYNRSVGGSTASRYGGGGSGGGGRGGERPYVAANAPWATGEYGGGGLPNGPRRGLPSGPRMR